jgi:hypothetical protein
MSQSPRLFRSRWVWVLVIGLCLTAAGLWQWLDTDANTPHPNPNTPWRVAFGRGSGWHGLNTVKVTSDGTVILHRYSPDRSDTHWKTATLNLSPTAVAEVLASVEENRLLGLQKEYRDEHISDGTQWVFLFQQGEYQKSVFFDNEFPRAIRRFAKDVDRILAANGSEQVVWQPAGSSRQHERELWDSIQKK